MSKSPIFIVGTGRSGTSWAGDVLSNAPGVHQVFEPFNPTQWDWDMIFRYDWQWPNRTKPYLRPDNDDSTYLEPVRRLLENRVPLSFLGRPLVGSVVRSGRSVGEWRQAAAERRHARKRGFRVLIKDPWASHLVPWLIAHFDVDVAHMYRHPCGVAAGLKRMNWNFAPNRFTTNPGQLEDLLAEVEKDLDEIARQPDDSIRSALDEWVCCTWPMIEFSRKYEKFVPVSYERLATDPAVEFRRLCERFGLEYSGAVEERVRETTEGPKMDPGSTEKFVFVRDSAASAFSWRERLTAGEIDRVLSSTERIRGELADAGFEIPE